MSFINPSPIVLFTYNRIWHTIKTIEALKKNNLASDSLLFIYSDGGNDNNSWEKVMEVRVFLKSITGFKRIEIIERDCNMGLAENIISGVTQIVNEYETVIVLEDDMVTSPTFLLYMNSALEYYKNNDDVISIHGYMYPIDSDLPELFFIRGADCWGWGTWKRGWDLFEPDGKVLLSELKRNKLNFAFDFDGSYKFTQMLKDQINGKNNSWAIRWYASAFFKKKLTLYPGKSLVQNIGNDSSGTNSIKTEVFNVSIDSILPNKFPSVVVEDVLARNQIINYFNSIRKHSLSNIIMEYLLSIWK